MSSAKTISIVPRSESHQPAAVSPKIYCGRDKSLTHRAIMFASLAAGTSRISHPLLGADCRSTLEIFRSLGVSIISQTDDELTLQSPGATKLTGFQQTLDCGNSGTTARLLLGLLSGLPQLQQLTFTGDASLSSRPMRRVVEPLRLMGAQIDGRDDGNLLPIVVNGTQLKPASIAIDKPTAQVKSSILLAGMSCSGKTQVRLPAGSRDHTERFLIAHGAQCTVETDGMEELVTIEGPWLPRPFSVAIPVDPSSAAFFAVLGLLCPGPDLLLPDVLNNPTRTGFVDVLQRMSQSIRIQDRQSSLSFIEPVFDLEISTANDLKGTTIETTDVPRLVDEIPILAVAAAFAEGASLFKGLAELRVKESDRLSKTAELLSLAGCESRIDGDELWIKGGLKVAKSFSFDPAHDHRLAMAAAVMAKKAEAPCQISDPDCVAVSFPNFFEELSTYA